MDLMKGLVYVSNLLQEALGIALGQMSLTPNEEYNDSYYTKYTYENLEGIYDWITQALQCGSGALRMPARSARGLKPWPSPALYAKPGRSFLTSRRRPSNPDDGVAASECTLRSLACIHATCPLLAIVVPPPSLLTVDGRLVQPTLALQPETLRQNPLEKCPQKPTAGGGSCASSSCARAACLSFSGWKFRCVRKAVHGP